MPCRGLSGYSRIRMDTLHPTIEEFIGGGLYACCVPLPSLPRDANAADQRASAHFDGTGTLLRPLLALSGRLHRRALRRLLTHSGRVSD